MTDIELVIKIDEEWLKDIKERIDNGCVDHEPWVAIANGTPLPKGHGRLIDVDELFLDIQTDEQMRLGEHLAWVKERIDNAQTIIEADRAESEEV
jgi:hypothetical protein